MKTTTPANAAVGMLSLCLIASAVQAEQNLLWRNQQTGLNYLYQVNQTEIIAQNKLNVVADTQWQVVATPDLDGDGETDVVWRHQSSGQNHLYLMKNGKISVSQSLPVIADLNWQVVATADVNNDGNQDIVWRNQQTGQLHAYQMQGATKLSGVDLPSQSSVWRLVTVADFTQDGYADLLWHNSSTGEVKLSVLQQGSLSSSSTLANVPDTQWQIAAVADFNGDQQLDLLWRHQTTGLNYLYLMNGKTVQQRTAINTVPSSWKIATVADFNDDNQADIVWRHQQSGLNYIYLMQGAQIAQQGYLNQVADMNWSIMGTLTAKAGQTAVTLTGLTSTQSSYSLKVDGTAQLSLQALFSNNTQQDVTALASWQSSAPGTVSVEGGLVTAVSDGSATITASYQGKTYSFNVSVATPVDHIQLFFEKPSGWADCYVYIWLPEPTGSVSTGEWPGVKMAQFNNDWCVYDLPKETTKVNLVFNDGQNGAQTDDLTRTATGWYTGDKWYDEDQTQDLSAPEISTQPPAGNHEDATLSVTIALDDQDPLAKAYYTVDGSTPSASSTPYTAAIKLTQNTQLNVFAIDTAGNQAVQSFQYNLNTDATKPTIEASLPSGQYETDQSVTFTIKDNKDPQPSVYFTTDGSTPTTASAPYTGQAIAVKDVGPGVDLKVQLLAVDNVGNQAIASYAYRIGKVEARSDFREETIYFLMTTRFYDGDPANNVHSWDDAKAGNPDTDPAWRGDFKGLIAKLDYIKALGFSAIWITPPVKNISGYDYHGYHASNFQEIDPRFDSNGDGSAMDEYQELIDEIHARDMKVIQDVVFNHTGNFGEENLHPLFRRESGTTLDENAETILTQIAAPGMLPDDYNSLLPNAQFQARISAMRAPLDVDNHYHNHNFSGGWEQYEVQLGSIAGDCQDLNTENPDVANYIVDSYSKYIDMGVDAFRIDTVKHISRLTFNNEFLPAFKARGGDKFFMFGEVATRYRSVWNDNKPAISTPFYTWKESTDYPWGDKETNMASAESHYNNNMDPSTQPSSDNHRLNGNEYHKPDWSMHSGMDVIDFPMHWAFKETSDAWRMALDNDHTYNDATFNVTYVDSHDYAPDTAPENQRYAGTQDDWAEKLSLLFSFRGIPTIYYGSEIEFMKGAPIDVGPNAPLATTGRAYFGDHLEGSVTASNFGEYQASGAVQETLQYPLAQHIIALNKIRRAVPALQKGQYSTEGIDGNFAFKRRYTDDVVDSMALVVISGEATFSGVPNGTWVDIVTGDTQSGSTVTANASGRGNIRVYVLNGEKLDGLAGTYIK